jgi:hypothetical protein
MIEKFALTAPNIPTSPSADKHEPTGESFSARFSEMPEPANDEGPYDRRKKPASEKILAEKPEKKRSKYLDIALAPDGGLEAAFLAIKNDAVEKWLITTGYITRKDDRLIVDKERLSRLRGEHEVSTVGDVATEGRWYIPKDIQDAFSIPPDQARGKTTGKDVLTFLQGCLAYTDDSDVPLPITTLPRTFTEASTGSYPPCHIKPWEVPLIKRSSWSQPVTLEDNTTTNLVELHIAELFHTLRLEPQGEGRFFITDPDTGERRVVVTNELAEKYLPVYGGPSTGTTALRHNIADFCQRYFKNLDRLGIITPTHFRKTSGSFETSIVAPSDRRLSHSSMEVSLLTPGGKGSKYYLGRDKIVGTDIPFDKDSMVVRYLDSRTAGVVRIERDFEEILCTFTLGTPQEIEEKRAEIKAKYLEKHGRTLLDAELGAHTNFGGAEMKERIRRYKVSDHLPPFPGEDPRDYADRVARLSDARLVSKDTREFFQRTNIGLHQLPWSEQLAASSILLDPRFKKDEIAAFCTQYGVDGLRTFIASTFGSNINRDILTLGERSPELATVTFQKFGEVLSAADDAKSLVQSLALKAHESATDTDRIAATIQSQLLRRAKALIEEITGVAKQSKMLSRGTIDQLATRLDAVRSDILLFTTTFKTARDEGHEVSMNDFRDSEFSNFSGAELLAEVSRMRTLYADSMRGYPEVTKQKLLADFDQHTHDGKSTFSLLRYKGEIAGFLCFTEINPGQKYVSAVTLDPRFQKAYIGETMIDEAFAREAENNILGADCVAEKSVSARYIENGFIGVRSWNDKGDLIMDIVRDDRRNEKYFSTKSLSQEEIVRLAPLGSIGTAYIEVVTDPKEHSFARCNEGFILTRYFKHKNTGKWYLVYEPKPIRVPENQESETREEALV